MNLELLRVGYCRHPEFVTIRGGGWRAATFPSIVGLIRHPVRGPVLFDTGYARHFLAATRTFPERLYRWTTPMHLPPSEALAGQLAQRGIANEDVRHVFISHFHADHIAGLRDFPAAEFICSGKAMAASAKRSRWSNLVKGQLPALLPPDFAARVRFIEDCPPIPLDGSLAPFTQARDLFQDGSLLAVPLPGHARGHHGLLVFQSEHAVFLVGDACWSMDALVGNRPPHPVTRLLMDDWSAYGDTLNRLAQLHGAAPDLVMVPSHCLKAFEAYGDRAD